MNNMVTLCISRAVEGVAISIQGKMAQKKLAKKGLTHSDYHATDNLMVIEKVLSKEDKEEFNHHGSVVFRIPAVKAVPFIGIDRVSALS